MSNPIKDFYWKIKFRFPRVNAVSVIGLLVAITALPAAVLLIRQATQLRSKAAPEAVTLSFSPSGVTLPPNQTISLNMDAKAYQIGFVRVDMSFDKSKVQLSGDIQTTSALKNVIVKTTQSDANNSGNISINSSGDYYILKSNLFDNKKIPLEPPQSITKNTLPLFLNYNNKEGIQHTSFASLAGITKIDYNLDVYFIVI